MFNPRSKSRKFWVGPEILGHYKVGECGSGTPLVEHFSLDLNIKWSIFGRTQPYAEYRNFATAENCRPCRAAARHAACAWSRWCRARPNVETLQSCKRTACPGSGKRVRNAEIATSPPSHAASCAATPPRQAAVARTRVRRARIDVGTSQTCAHAARTGAGNTPESPEVEVVGGEGRSG